MSEETAPFCLCLAGPNGSGKSTVTKGLRQVHQLDNWIDPDVVAERVRDEYRGRMSQSDISQTAFSLARTERLEYASKLTSFGFETVFSHISNVDFLDALKTLGYVVHLYFICTDDPKINVGRVRNRHDLGGHDVPEDKIIDRYYRALDHLRQSTRRYDRIVLIDNSAALTPGQAIGQIVNGGGTKIEMFPRPHLPDWVIDTTRAFQRFALGARMVAENSDYKDDPGRRMELLDRFRV